MVKAIIVASTYRQAVLAAEQLRLQWREWKHASSPTDLRGYGPSDIQYVQCEPPLFGAGPVSIPERNFYDALGVLRDLERRGANIQLIET